MQKMNEPKRMNVTLFTLLRQASHLQAQRIGQLQGRGLILVLLHEHGTLTQRQLSELTQRRAATLSEQLENMEKAGLVLREKNAADKRTIDVSLTEKGKRTAKGAEQERATTADELFSILEDEERRQLHRTLKKLTAAWWQQQSTYSK